MNLFPHRRARSDGSASDIRRLRGRIRRWPRLNRHWGKAFVAALTILLIIIMVADPAAAGVAAAPPQDVNAVLTNIRNWLMGILAALGTVFLTIAGLRYLISGGDPGEVGKAKEALKYAACGYGLAALAPLVVNILKSIAGT